MDVSTVETEKQLKEKYGPWALIVGASLGVGAEFARRIAAAGIHCILLDRDTIRLNDLKTELEKVSGVAVVTVATDLEQAGAIDAITAAVADKEVGLLIYNAGSPPYSRQFLKGELNDWSGLLQKNVHTVMECCYQFGGKMVGRGRGGVILIGSHAAFGGTKKLSVYTATKGFIANLGESLWVEWRDQGVDVLNLFIGTTDTPMLRETMAQLGIEMTDDMGISRPEDIVTVALRELPNGPTYVLPESDPDSLLRSEQRRAHVLESTRVAAVFIGEE